MLFRSKSISAQLEPHLVVALACCAVADRIRLGFACNLHQTFSDQRTGNRSAQQVFTFVERIRAEHGEDEIAHKLFAQIFNENVLGFDPFVTQLSSTEKITLTPTAADLAKQVDIVWLMIPAGEAIDACLAEIMPALKAGSIVIDGGNSFYKDSIRRNSLLTQSNIHFLDCGTSGGIHGMEHGFSLMVGGTQEAFNAATPVLKILCCFISSSFATLIVVTSFIFSNEYFSNKLHKSLFLV